MRTAATTEGRRITDLTARARIRDAAVECFAESGFDTPFRTIAARADVSPGLITHHFGSKAALRAECDAEVVRRYHDLKTEAVGSPNAFLLDTLVAPGPAAIVTVYMIRAIHDGGASARTFLDNLVDEVRVVMAESVASGLVRPSRDEEARLRFLTSVAIGSMLVQFLVAPDTTPEAFVASLRDSRRDTVLPMLELYTEGLLADRTLLDDYVQFLWQPPDRAGHNGQDGQDGTPTPA